MKELTIINQNGKLLIDSREVAEMVGKQHANLLRDIEGYIQILENSKLSSQNFFIESSYTDARGQKYERSTIVNPKRPMGCMESRRERSSDGGN